MARRRMFLTVLLSVTSIVMFPLSMDLRAEEAAAELAAGDYPAALKWLASQFQAAKQKSQRDQLIVWLFDESATMKEDQFVLLQHFHNAYEKADSRRTTVIHSFGRGVYQLMRQPVPDAPPGIKAIHQAVDRIPIDTSGNENMCGAVESVVRKWTDQQPQRQVVIVVVTDEEASDTEGLDETGSRTNTLEDVVELCRRTETPVFVLGREASFGTHAGRIVWKDPAYGLNHWIPVLKGPDSPFPERLQWAGFGKVTDAVPCGFGPYSQERLCRETGGGFFLITDTVGRTRRRRQAMAGYEPDWRSRKVYADDLGDRPLRQTCRSVISSLDPFANERLNLRERGFSVNEDEFAQQQKEHFVRAVDVLRIVTDAVRKLEAVKHLRDSETSERWRANFDLLYAQVLASQARLPQYIATVNTHASEKPRPLQPKHNRWMVTVSTTPPAMLTDEQFRPIQLSLELASQRDAYLTQLAATRATAAELLKQIEAEYPGTPWAEIARRERSRGFNVELRSYFHDPKYDMVGKQIRLPKF